MQVSRLFGHVRLPEKIDPQHVGLTIFSAESFNLEYSESHAFRTGLRIQIPDGQVGLLIQPGGDSPTNGCALGHAIGPADINELRINIINNNRNALQVVAGQTPLAQLIMIEAEAPTIEEVPDGDLKDELIEARDTARAEALADKARDTATASRETKK